MSGAPDTTKPELVIPDTPEAVTPVKDSRFRDIAYSEINTKIPTSTLREVKSARRHAIKISNIVTEKVTYSSRTSKTKNLITAPTDRIAIHANEYIPEHFANDEWVQYELLVNGKTYKIVPLNSNKAGTKIIKHSTYNDEEQYAIIIDEPIKEAYLTIKIKTPNSYETPFVSNLKVVTGKGV